MAAQTKKKPSPSSQARSRKSKAGSQRKSGTMLFDLLKEDHEKVRELFENLEENEESESAVEVFSELETELGEHMEMEEQFFYPELEASEDSHDEMLEAIEEHHVAKTVLAECSSIDPNDEHWMAKVKVLKEIVEHHIDEEESSLFKVAKKVLDADQLQAIAQKIQEQKGEVSEM